MRPQTLLELLPYLPAFALAGGLLPPLYVALSATQQAKEAGIRGAGPRAQLVPPWPFPVSPAFQTEGKLYLILDFLRGGDLFTRLSKEVS